MIEVVRLRDRVLTVVFVFAEADMWVCLIMWQKERSERGKNDSYSEWGKVI